MPSLGTSHFVGFVMWRLKYYCNDPNNLGTQTVTILKLSKLFLPWKDADGMANSVDPDQSDLGPQSLPYHVCLKKMGSLCDTGIYATLNISVKKNSVENKI